MKANQVVIVMDREEAEMLLAAGLGAGETMAARTALDMSEKNVGQFESMAQAVDAIRAALDRDPDELVEQGAASLHARHIPLEWGISFDDCSDEIQDEYRAMARSVLAVLGEEETK